jgi:hypothetical protein
MNNLFNSFFHMVRFSIISVFMIVMTLCMEEISFAQASSAADYVQVESIQVQPSNALSQTEAEAILDLKVGQDITSAKLDERLQTARGKMVASGLYETVDVSLDKGSRPGSYKVILNVHERPRFYSSLGARLFRYSGPFDDSGYSPVDGNVQRNYTETTASLGTRNFMSTGLHTGFNLSLLKQRPADDKTAVPFFDGEDASERAEMSAFLHNPNLFGSPFFLTGRLYMYDAKDNLGSSYGNRELISGLMSSMGYQIGLWRPYVDAGVFDFEEASFNNTESSAEDPKGQPIKVSVSRPENNVAAYGAGVLYTEKSGIGMMEPGTTARFGYQGQNGYYEVAANSSHTFLVDDVYALTPALAVVRAGMIDGGGILPSTLYDANLKYQYLLWDKHVLSLTVGMTGEKRDRVPTYATSYPAYRTEWNYSFVTPNFTGNLGLIIGRPNMTEERLPIAPTVAGAEAAR